MHAASGFTVDILSMSADTSVLMAHSVALSFYTVSRFVHGTRLQVVLLVDAVFQSHMHRFLFESLPRFVQHATTCATTYVAILQYT